MDYKSANIKHAKEEWLKFGCINLWNQILNHETLGLDYIHKLLGETSDTYHDEILLNQMRKEVNSFSDCTSCQIGKIRQWPLKRNYKPFIQKAVIKHIEIKLSDTGYKLFTGDEIYYKLFP